jgi:hypothetical protein
MNKISLNDKIISKIVNSKQGLSSEIFFLKYFRDCNKIVTPKLLGVDVQNSTVHIEYIYGVPLIKFIRTIEKGGFLNEEKIILALVQKSLDYLTYFHECSKKIINASSFYSQQYEYKKKLDETLITFEKFLKIPLPVYKYSEIIAYKLNSMTDVLYRDAGLYNIHVSMPKNKSLDIWIDEISKIDNVDYLISDLELRLYNIDFAESHKIICAEDDYSFIIESSISRNIRQVLLDRMVTSSRYEIYLLSAIYRCLRVSARHLEYLFQNPELYTERYTNYGSLIEESPLYYLTVAYDRSLEISVFYPDFRTLSTFIKNLIDSLSTVVNDKLMELE